ncbi:hypothetical protein L7F22_028569 [Adiantum nelumboides]|nr:hypothetical protein [Adiantum nelumboides]
MDDQQTAAAPRSHPCSHDCYATSFTTVQEDATACDLTKIKAGFQAVCGLPNCCGAIDATHINIHLSKNETNESWYNRYGNYSMVVQGIVDANMRFLDVKIGWPGSCNDKRVLQNSGFYRPCQGREHLAGPSFNHENLSIQEYIVGDGGYVLLPWLLIPYSRPMLQSTSHCRYNFFHSSTRIVVEQAFGRLKETWKFLGGTSRSPNLLTLPSTIQACCILHNMLMDLANE